MESIAKMCAAAVVAKKKTKAAAAQEYAREWKRVFHRALPLKSAEAAISFAVSAKGTRKQRGGMAPLNHDLRAGVMSAPTLPGQADAAGYTMYGQVPAYVASGFMPPPQPALASTCGGGKDFYTPAPYADIGNNAVVPAGAAGAPATMGGGRRKTLRRGKKQHGGMSSLTDAFGPLTDAVRGATFGAVASTNPSGPIQDSITAMRGLPLPASPDATDAAWTYKMSPGAVSYANSDASALTRGGSELFRPM